MSDIINNINIHNLRNADYTQYIQSGYSIFIKHGIDKENLQPLYTELGSYVGFAEVAMAEERHNAKIREKNDADNYRDKLHDKLYKYLESILCDERDPLYGDALTIMKVVNESGNPKRLAENAESTMLTALGNRLEAYRTQLEKIGALQTVEILIDANNKFIRLEKECREITASQNLNRPLSMSEVRKKADAVYRIIVGAINGYALVPSKKEAYRGVVAEMNVLIAKYNALITARKRKKGEEDEL